MTDIREKRIPELRSTMRDAGAPIEQSLMCGDGLWQSPQKDFALLHPVDTQSVLVYSSGLQISVDMDSSGHLRAVIKVPQSFYNRTVGLLGQWNGDKMDDFLYSNGKRLSFKDGKIPTEKAIYDFGLSWTVPQPEILIPSDQESSNFQPVFMEELLTSVSADILEQNRNTCRGKIPCLHDFLATGLIDVGMQTIKFLEKSEKMLALFGNMPPSITGPSVIQCKVNFNNTFVFMAVDRNNDTISFSLLLPVPDGAIMNPVTGELTWTPRNANPVVLTVQVNDQLSETVTSPVIQMCNCMNGGTCDYSRIIQNHRKGKFQVVGCLCPQGFSGPLCSNITESCKGRPCFPGIGCTKQPSPQLFSCAKCPPGTVAKDKEGYKCFQQNINECLSPSACPNAKFECINTVGSVQCSCRYQNAQDTETCGDSANPPGWNIFNCTLKWSQTSSSPKDTTKMLRHILALGFENKFYNASLKTPEDEGSTVEYRLNVSSDTPHWYVRDYLTRVSHHYGLEVSTILVGDLNECSSGEASCVGDSRCENTYGGYKCMCNSSSSLESQSCTSDLTFKNNSIVPSKLAEADYRTLILGLVLGIGIPLLILLLIAVAISCCLCTRKKKMKREIPSAPSDCILQEIFSSPFSYSDPALFYKVHYIPRMQSRSEHAAPPSQEQFKMNDWD
ncbi:mucin-like protein [Erpetoichthys calabaricus]|uniref:mucin-like protein n=1 Tax=Erpetoichthys calabaricus TaxID=27687 RepID=UPI002234356F|nr:mucin-like protein [Erpetoichthys calabaricus]